MEEILKIMRREVLSRRRLQRRMLGVLERCTSKVSEEVNRDMNISDLSLPLDDGSDGPTAFSNSPSTYHSGQHEHSMYSEGGCYSPPGGSQHSASMISDREETVIEEEDIQLDWDPEEARKYIESEIQAAQASYRKISSHTLERKRGRR